MHRMTHRRKLGLVALTVTTAGAIALSGCASDAESGAAAPTDRLNGDYYQAAVDAAKAIMGDTQMDSSIEFIGVNGGAEGDVLKGVYQAFTDATGTAVNYTGTQDINSIVQSRVQGGNPPDVVDQSIGVALDYAEQGKLMDVSSVVGDDALKANFSQSLLDGASYDGRVFGLYQGFNNFMVWYNPEQYGGPKEPTDWAQLTQYTDEQASQGSPAWCIAEEAGGGSGFPGAQFIENLFAKMYGPEKLRQWGAGELDWTSPEVKSAWQAFGDIATDDAKVSGGVAGSLSSAIATGYNGLVADPATCQLALWGSWVPGLIGAGVEPGTNMDFFRVPGFDNDYDGTEIFQTTVTTAFNDTPTVEAFMKYVASPEAQRLLASANQWPVADTQVSPDVYTSTLLQKSAETFFNGDIQLTTGPNVMADAATSAAFYKGVVSYLQDPSSLDDVLATIQAASSGS